MMQLAVFVLVLAAVFGLKAWAIVKTHDEIIADSTSFSWMSAREPRETPAAERIAEQPQESAQPAHAALRFA